MQILAFSGCVIWIFDINDMKRSEAFCWNSPYGKTWSERNLSSKMLCFKPACVLVMCPALQGAEAPDGSAVVLWFICPSPTSGTRDPFRLTLSPVISL